jgi:hypothetical protein
MEICNIQQFVARVLAWAARQMIVYSWLIMNATNSELIRGLGAK